MRRHLIALRDGNDLALNDYIDHCLADAKHWGQYLLYLNALGLAVEEVAFGNVAMCALATNDAAAKADEMYRQCAQRFTGKWLEVLAPEFVILMGSRARALRPLLSRRLLRVEETMHYAVGGSHRARLNRQLAGIGEILREARIKKSTGG